ncbi:acid phosphatase [Enterobacter roggenkampii]|uniref:acid phosphatase n=1 Tax=Enterobacter roggenkampii TaxID=1812935 RepID=UPI003BE129AA
MKHTCLAILFSLSISNAIAFDGGYLKGNSPDSALELPPPPKEGSKLFNSDINDYKKGLQQKGSSRWVQAISDANMSQKNLERFFSNPMDEKISQKRTPSISKLIGMMRYDAGYYSTIGAKEKYKRARPFSYFKTNSCTPQKDQELSSNGSYPSGHAATAWTVALVLAEIKPTRTKQLIEAAYSYGESRVICGAHWQSDVAAGRQIGSSLFLKLNSNGEFLKTLNDARKEIKDEI